MKEIIKNVIGFEGHYKISNQGYVIRLKRQKRLVNGQYMDLPEKVIKPKAKCIGYPTVSFNINKKQYTRSMHRLMAIHFIKNDNPLIKNEVNHKDKNINNYNLSNLEWCTRSENVKHSKNK